MTRLPQPFADLEPFVEKWALATENERYDAREQASMEEIERFYDAMLPRTGQALEYLDGYPLDALPAECRTLMYLLFSFATISFCVEIWKQPKVPDTGLAKILSVEEPLPI